MTGSNKKKAAAQAAPRTKGQKQPGDLSEGLARAPSARTWPTETDSALRAMLRRLKNPKLTQTDLLDYMVGSGCPIFADELAMLWGYALVDELTPARQKQLPKSMKPAAPPKKAAAPKGS